MTDESSFSIRLAEVSDIEAILSILREVACQVPVNLTTPAHIQAMREQIQQRYLDSFSLVAIDQNGMVTGFQLARKICLCGETYIELRYAAVTAAATRKEIFRELIKREKHHGLLLVAEVKPDNKSNMTDRLIKYGFLHWGNNEYRWSPT